MSLSVRGIGVVVPAWGIDQADAAEISLGLSCRSDEQRRLLPVLYRRAGVKHRHSVVLEANAGPIENRQSFFAPAGALDDRGPTTAARMDRYEQEAGALAASAARLALTDAGIAADAVTHLVTVSCSGFCAPGFDVALIEKLPLPPQTARTHVGFMGCHGALNAIRVARAFAEADPDSVTLVVCVELCSLHHQYGWDPDQIVANALFADGAAALVCCGRSHPERAGCLVLDNGSTLVPGTTDAMGWRIRDHGFEMNLSPQVPDLIHRHLRPWLMTWLAKNELTVADIGSWAVHPGGPRILSACGEALELPRERLADSIDILAEFGNMSSPTVLFILDRLRRRNAPTPCVMLGFGPGLAIEAALVEW
ncbi:MAG: type III polyketide synthase [Planctomycetaceae bacterium]|nr:type III polyketide synthase [Planctomycetaceae bacterium]